MKKRVYFRRLDINSEDAYTFGDPEPRPILTRVALEVEFIDSPTVDFLRGLQEGNIFIEVEEKESCAVYHRPSPPKDEPNEEKDKPKRMIQT